MPLAIVQVDAFTDRPFAGNPAAVCLLPAWRDDGWLSDVAREMNLSETAFLVRHDTDAFELRWFTPETEVALCGHATLASAHVLWEDGILPIDATARFHTLSGELTARRGGPGIEMEFPATSPTAIEPVPGLLEALGAEPVFVGRSRFDAFLELRDEHAVRALTPDFALLRRVDTRGVIVTARSASAEYDFVSRFFAPAVGIAEDPVTGSAHCALAPYWRERLGPRPLVGYQASRRGGTVHVEQRGERVVLGGQAVTVLRGELLVGA